MFTKFEQDNFQFKTLTKKKTQIRDILFNYLPTDCVEYVVHLLETYPVKFKIVRPRKTKLGDFRWDPRTNQRQITVNGNLNEFSFLITTLHEFSHLIAFERFGRKILAHGKEWKTVYKEILEPVLEKDIFPEDIKTALLRSLNSMKASSCSDVQLQRALRNHEKTPSNELLLEEIPKNSTFVLNGKTFRRKNLRRTRFLCEEVATGKPYLINRLARVSLQE